MELKNEVEKSLTLWERRRAPAVRLKLAFRSAKTFIFTPRFSYTVEKLHCGADRVVAPSGSRQFLSVCRRDFPMQGDVAPKARIGRKNFSHQTLRDELCAHLLWKVPFPLCLKSFWNS